MEEPEVLDTYMLSASSHLLGLGERQCIAVVFEDSRFGSVWNGLNTIGLLYGVVGVVMLIDFPL